MVIVPNNYLRPAIVAFAREGNARPTRVLFATNTKRFSILCWLDRVLVMTRCC